MRIRNKLRYASGPMKYNRFTANSRHKRANYWSLRAIAMGRTMYKMLEEDGLLLEELYEE